MRVPGADGAEVWARLQDSFAHEYVLDLETLHARVQPPARRDALLHYLEAVLGADCDVLRLRNKTPRKRTKALLSLKYALGGGEVRTTVGSNELRGPKVYLKVQQSKKVTAECGGLLLKLSLTRTSGERARAEQQAQEGEARPPIAPYRAVHSSDSEVDARDPATYTCTFYNHNGILAASTRELSSGGGEREAGVARHRQLPAQAAAAQEYRAGRRA